MAECPMDPNSRIEVYLQACEDIKMDIKKLSEDAVHQMMVILVRDANEKAKVEAKMREDKLKSWIKQPAGFDKDPKLAVAVYEITPELYRDFVEAVGKIKPEYKSDLSKLQDKQSPCIFVRFASLYRLYHTVDDSSLNEVAQLALELGTGDHFVLVVGDPVNLKEELTAQVLQVCKLAQLEDNEIKKMLGDMKEKMEMSYHGANLKQSRAVSLLLSPTIDELQKVLSNSVSWDIHIIYAGHGDTEGLWIFKDGEYFGKDEILESIRRVEVCRHVYLVLDCCYASKLFKADEQIEKYIDVYVGLNPDIPRLSWPPPEDINRHDYVEWNKKFTKLMVQLYTRRKLYKESSSTTREESSTSTTREKSSSTNLKRLFPVQVKLDVIGGSTISVYIYPLSTTYLGPQGAMNALYGINEEVKEYTKGSIYFSRGPPLERAMDNHLRPTDYPQLVCFPAGNGDSTLFRWHGFNMLIDGGVYSRKPCFWPVVGHLPPSECLNEVIVTHYDDDHINGILRLFQERELPIDVKCLHTVYPYEDAPGGGRSAMHGAELVKKARAKRVPIRNLRASDFPVIHVHFIRTDGEVRPHVMNGPGCDINGEYNGECLSVYMLTPTNTAFWERVQIDLQIKLDELNRLEGRGLSDPNMASASLLIHCRFPNGTSRFALLTGDAPCQPILDGLRRIQCVPKTQDAIPKYKLDYADVPHHGSSKPENHPELFFQSIEASVVMISTNGKQHYHPDPPTLRHLCRSLESRSVKHACFTYGSHNKCSKKKPGTRRTEDVSSYFVQDLHGYLHFPEVNHCTYIDLSGNAEGYVQLDTVRRKTM